MGRRTLVAALIGLGAVLGVLAILAVWVSRQVMETDQWVDTSSQVLENPAVQSALSTYLVDELYANVDVSGEIRSALPPRAQPLAAPVAGALRRGAEQVVDRALDRPRVQQAWESANRAAHKRLVQVIEGGGDVVGTNGGTVTLDLQTLVGDMAQRTGIGSRVADKLPASTGNIVLLRSDQLDAVQTIAKALKPLAFVLVLLTLACFGAAIALSTGRRRQALRASGWAFVAAGLIALVARQLLGGVVVDDLAQGEGVKPAVQATWDIGTSLLAGVAWATIAYGLVVVVGTWFAGPTRLATRGRAAISPELRDPWICYGATAGIVLLVLLWGPTEGTRRPLPALLLAALLFAGVTALRHQTMREFPDAARGPAEPVPAVAERPPAQADSLARLDALHRDGVLSDAEYASAKENVLTRR